MAWFEGSACLWQSLFALLRVSSYKVSTPTYGSVAAGVGVGGTGVGAGGAGVGDGVGDGGAGVAVGDSGVGVGVAVGATVGGSGAGGGWFLDVLARGLGVTLTGVAIFTGLAVGEI